MVGEWPPPPAPVPRLHAPPPCIHLAQRPPRHGMARTEYLNCLANRAPYRVARTLRSAVWNMADGSPAGPSRHHTKTGLKARHRLPGRAIETTRRFINEPCGVLVGACGGCSVAGRRGPGVTSRVHWLPMWGWRSGQAQAAHPRLPSQCATAAGCHLQQSMACMHTHRRCRM